MKEPILSREEVLKIAARLGSQSLNVTRVHELNGPTRTIFDDAGLEEFAAALLEKLCGEPIPYGYEFLDMAGTNHFVRGSLPAYAQSEIIPLYTLKDRQS